MSNALHDLGDVFHRFGEEIKSLADKIEGMVKKDVPVAEHITEDAANAAGEAAIKTVETDVEKA